MDQETSTTVKSEYYNGDNIDEEIEEQNTTNGTNILESSFFPKELLLEEKRLKEEHKENLKTEVNLLKNFNEHERKERYQNLLALLENSIKLTSVFETRLQKCKQQIMRKEVEKSKSVKQNLSDNEEGQTKVIDEDEYYFNLFQQPKLFNGSLKNHQIEGLLWIRTLFENGVSGILADDMGLGKTIQTIAFYCFLIEMGLEGPFLIVAPLSTIPNWLSEFSKFAPQLSTILYHGTASDRSKTRSRFNKTIKINNLTCYPVIITTYEVIRVDINQLITIDWKYITVDEGHKLKNVNTDISQCMRKFSCTNKLILTGTPIQNNLTELWSLLNLIMPKLFDKLEDFNSWFVIDDFFDSNDKIACMAKKDEILDTIIKILRPFILRREKSETDLNLPPKKEVIIYAPLTEYQQELYKATLNKHMEILLNKQDKDGTIYEHKPKRKCVEKIVKYTELNAIKKKEPVQEEDKAKDMAISVIMQNPFMQLKKIANHPYLVHMPLIPGTNEVLVDENIVKVSGKFQVLDAMLSKLKLLGHKVLLFSTMTQILDIIEEFLILRSYQFSRLDGTMNIVDRVTSMNLFNIEPNCFLMLISTRAGGLGLNLTTADTVIIFDSDWNPQCDLQAQDRCHRMGQQKPVVVYRFCSKNTVDEKILERAVAKRKLEKMIMGNGMFNRSTKLSAAGIEELMNLLQSSEYTKKIQSNGFIFTDEELDALMDRSDMIKSVPKINTS